MSESHVTDPILSSSVVFMSTLVVYRSVFPFLFIQIKIFKFFRLQQSVDLRLGLRIWEPRFKSVVSCWLQHSNTPYRSSKLDLDAHKGKEVATRRPLLPRVAQFTYRSLSRSKSLVNPPSSSFGNVEVSSRSEAMSNLD